MRLSTKMAVAGFALVTILAMAAAANAQTGVLFVKDSRVVVGDPTPTATLDVVGAPGTVGTGNAVIKLRNSGPLAFQLDDTAVAGFWNFAVAVNETSFRISKSGTGATELELDQNGNLTIQGACSEGASGSCADYVFEPDYELRSLDELEAFITTNKHLPNVPSTDDIMKNGLSIQKFQGRLLEKIEELTLYTLAQEKTIRTLEQRLATLESQ